MTEKPLLPQILLQAKEILIMVVLVIFSIFLCYGIYTMRQVNTAVVSVTNAVNQTNKLVADVQKNVDNLSYHANAILIETGLTAMQVRKTSLLEAQDLQTMSTQVQKILSSLQNTSGEVTETVKNMNDTILETKTQVTTIGGSTNAALLSIPPVLNEIQQSTASLNVAVNSANTLIQDPSNKQILYNVDQTTGNIASSTKRIDNKLADMFKPEKWFITVGKTLLGTVANVITIFK